MNRQKLSYKLFFLWLEQECISAAKDEQYYDVNGIAYIHQQSWYISPIVEVGLILNEKEILLSAHVPCTDVNENEGYTEKYPRFHKWSFGWDQ